MALSKLINKVKTDYPAYREDFYYSVYTFFRFKLIRFRRAWHHHQKASYLRQLSDNSFLKKITKTSIKNDQQFFFDPEKIAEAITPFKTEIIAEADKICDHEFNLLGSGPVKLGNKINWHLDFKANHEFPTIHNTLVSYTAGAGHDIKVPWELSRFQHLSTLGQAYALTKDKKYSQEFIDQITDWTKNNPLYFGANWKCTMDVAIRAANWTMAWWFFKDCPEIDNNFRTRFYVSLFQHGKYIINNLEWGVLTSNHYLANITGLTYLGLMFPEFKNSNKWLRRGIHGLKKEMQKQVYPDGVDFEASIAYHRLVLESFAYPAILCQLNHQNLSTDFWQRLEEMFEFTAYYTKQNGLAPMIGDCDDGRIHIMSQWSDWEKRDHSYLLNLAAQLFNNENFAPYLQSSHPETALLSQNLAAQNNKKPIHRHAPSSTNLNSRSFNYGGIYIFRNHNLHCTVTAAPNGQAGNGGHAHNDKLSFELHKNGQDFIVDPGSYIYTPDPENRNRFRSTRMHNTVFIDETEINKFTPPYLFRMEENAHPELEKWHLGSEKDELIVSHNGYARLSHPLIHQRHFIFDKHSSTISFTDIIGPPVDQTSTTTHKKHNSQASDANTEHTLEWNFHLAPEVEITYQENQFLFTNNGQQLTFTPPENLNFTIEESEYSPSYGVKVPSKSLRATHKTSIPEPIEFNFSIN